MVQPLGSGLSPFWGRGGGGSHLTEIPSVEHFLEVNCIRERKLHRDL